MSFIVKLTTRQPPVLIRSNNPSSTSCAIAWRNGVREIPRRSDNATSGNRELAVNSPFSTWARRPMSALSNWDIRPELFIELVELTCSDFPWQPLYR